MGGSTSDPFDISTEPIKQEELRYLYVSNVKVSNFVSVKLLDKSSHTLWKEQMICLLDSQNMRGFVDPESKLPEVKSSTIMEQYKSLVKGWIFRSLNEDMLKRVINSGCRGPQEIWSALETICHPIEAPTGSGGASIESLAKAGDRVSEPINEEELRYLYVSNVNVSNFVSVRLLTKSNYTIWKKQMLCLLDSHNLRGFVDHRFNLPLVKSSEIMERYKSLVEGWIYGSLNEYMLKVLVYIRGPREIWSALETICDPQEAPTGSAGSSSTEWPKPVYFSEPINEEKLRYLYASNVKVYNFVSMKLWGAGNYTTWKKQMRCLLDSENLCRFVDPKVDPPEISDITKTQYKSLVKGWILGSLNEYMLEVLAYQKVSWDEDHPQFIWEKLERLCDPKEDVTYVAIMISCLT